ncbi:MAG TPA: galactose-1-epimerase [Gammaproteobacteria bacterium]|nr:galactose-1-epimerase [Gammaproteobacteria bacterium]
MIDDLAGFYGQLTPDGETLRLFNLTNSNGFEVTFMDWGATWLSCKVPMKAGPLRETLLRSATLQDHLAHTVYLGATVGRYANRIKGGAFDCNGEPVVLSRNHFDNTLHGGDRGFDRHSWTGIQQDEATVVFSRRSPDGEEGFPGEIDVKVTYQVSGGTAATELTATYESTTDKRTPINLTNHAYFNLSNDQTILDHTLSLEADLWLPVDAECIPVAGLQNVNGTLHDFRIAKIFRDSNRAAIAYDHSYLFRTGKTPVLKQAARLSSPAGDLSLEIMTDKPAIQLYNGEHLEGLPGAGGDPMKKYAGIALETQFLPDSPNHPDWPHESSFVEPGQTYRYQTIFRFSQ